MKKVNSAILQFIILFTIFAGLRLFSPVSSNFHSILPIFIPVLLIITIVLRKKLYKKTGLIIIIWILLFIISTSLYDLSSQSKVFFLNNLLINLVIVVLFSWFAAKLANALEWVEQKLINIDPPKRVLPFDQANSKIQAEFIRAKRYNFPLAVMVLEPIRVINQNSETLSIVSEMRKTKKNQIIQTIGEYLLVKLRRSDLIIRNDDKSHILLICPILHTDTIHDLEKRIIATLEEDLRVEVRIETRAFPDDGSVFEALYQSLIE